MKTLSVLYKGWGENWPLGTLASTREGVYFEFSPEALTRGLTLSPLRLKLTPGAVTGFPAHQFRLPGIIADALPDGWGLYLMDKLFRRSGVDPASVSVLDRLAWLGDRSLGALAFEPAEKVVQEPDLTLMQLAVEVKAITDEPNPTLLRTLAQMGGSPHGARPKVLVPWQGEPWLVKFPSRGEPAEVCRLEDAYAQWARACGIEVPPTQVWDLGPELAAFGTRRFDRQGSDRVPVFTLAALLDADFRIPSSVDYATFLRLTRFLTKDEVQVRQAFRRCVFNVVFHNRDDHPKNHAFLLDRDGQWHLSPAYDLTYSNGPGGEHHMDIEGEGRAPERSHLLQLAQKADLKSAVARGIIDEVVAVAEAARSALPFELEAW